MGRRSLTSLLAAGAVVGACAACAADASATPTASTPPSITGSSVYGSTLTCNNGTWSVGAGNFTYSWELADGGLQIASGPTLTVRAGWVGYGLVCAITATDATGTATATSPAVTAEPLTPVLKLTEARLVSPGRVTIAGRISPVASLQGGAGSLILYRETKAGPQQLTFNGAQTRPNVKTGAFAVTAVREPAGRNTYVLQYIPSALGYAPQVTVTRTITVTG